MFIAISVPTVSAREATCDGITQYKGTLASSRASLTACSILFHDSTSHRFFETINCRRPALFVKSPIASPRTTAGSIDQHVSKDWIFTEKFTAKFHRRLVV